VVPAILAALTIPAFTDAQSKATWFHEQVKGGVRYAQRQAVLLAAEDVEDALMTLSQTELHVAELQDQVQSLERARDLSEQAYRAGSIPLTDVLDADRQLLAARDELEANRAGSARAAVGVFRAFGGGWDPAGST